MGCVSSKLVKEDLAQESLETNKGDFPNHTVSLTSTTYGVLELHRIFPIQDSNKSPSLSFLPKKGDFGELEVINTWELMQDLDDQLPVSPPPPKELFKSQPLVHTVAEAEARNGSQGSNLAKSEKRKKKFVGKENKQRRDGGLEDGWGRAVLKPFTSLENLQIPARSPLTARSITNPSDVMKPKKSVGKDSPFSSSRRGSSPLFDPDLLASFEKEISDVEEQIKKMVSPGAPNRGRRKSSDSALEQFEKKCPPGGENAVVIYTTTLRGIRKTFEDCNRVRSIIESHDVQMIERDISMDSGYRKELKALMVGNSMGVPLVFVKGRFIGGADEVSTLEEEGKLKCLFEGIPRAQAWCEGCGGVRFVMCMDCSGSCKVLDEEGKARMRCGECNENGLIHCPICC